MAAADRAKARRAPESVAVTLRLPVTVAAALGRAARVGGRDPGEVVAELIVRYLRPPS